MSQRGWSAKGLLAPLWRQYDGGREALAKKVGTTPTVLSSINTAKRNLGIDLGSRLAAELGVSLRDLGAPLALAEPMPEHETMEERVARLARQLEDIAEAERAVREELREVQRALGSQP